MTLKAIDVQTFAGAFHYGVHRAGFDVVAKRELPGGFGSQSVLANLDLLNPKLDYQDGPHETWDPIDVPFIAANPPCSGFSAMSAASFRGIDSPANACMHALIEFSARCDPEIVIFESVQQAFNMGRPLMQALRGKLETLTGSRYNLHHVLHNGAHLGGAAIRRRYFFVASRVPFGVEAYSVPRVPTLEESIGDLRDLEVKWGPQPYAREATWWSSPLRSRTGTVDGHYTRSDSPAANRMADLRAGVPWNEGETISVVARRYYETYGKLPESWASNAEKLIENDFRMGFYQAMRWDADRPSRVITGAGTQLVLHPFEDRTLTQRECARIQGFPDDWKIEPLQTVSSTHMFWGKGIPVQCGEWIARAAHDAITGTPQPVAGETIGDREFLIELTEGPARADERIRNFKTKQVRAEKLASDLRSEDASAVRQLIDASVI